MIEGRVVSTCNLGPLIRADMAAADSLQQTGLIKWRGSCEILGLITPAMGSLVTFTYTVQGQAERSIPKRFRVLSSFADPLANNGQGQTTVQFGCYLTFMADAREPAELNVREDTTLGNDQQADSDFEAIGASISAAFIFAECASRIDVSYAGAALTSSFRRDAINLEQGYVNVMSDLLVSESLVGELDATEVLQIRSLDVDGGTGPVLNTTNLISIGPMGVGELPGEDVAVQYTGWTLNEPDPDEGLEDEDDDDMVGGIRQGWGYNETIGPSAVSYVQVGDTAIAFPYTPRSKTITQYRSLLIDGRVQAVVDFSETISTTTLAASAPEYFAAVFEATGTLPTDRPITTFERTSYTYYRDGAVRSVITTKSEDRALIAGRLNITLNYGSEVVGLPGGNMLSERTYTHNTYSRNGQCSVAREYRLWPFTQQGQQAAAASNSRLENASQAAQLITELLGSGIVSAGTTVTFSKGSGDENRVPSDIERQNINNQDGGAFIGNDDESDEESGGPLLSSQTKTVWVYGDVESIRRKTFTMPYAPDDFIGGTPGNYFKISSNAEEVARRYGRVQNRILYGARYGWQIQAAPYAMPSMTFDPVYVSLAGVVGQFRLNNLSYVIEPGEVVAGANALFWGAVGTAS
jgi:hypothetical protein